MANGPMTNGPMTNQAMTNGRGILGHCDIGHSVISYESILRMRIRRRGGIQYANQSASSFIVHLRQDAKA